MTTKKYTTFSIVGILCLTLCSALFFYHLAHPVPATHPYPYNNLSAPQRQAHRTSASTPSTRKYRLATTEDIPPAITHFIKNQPLLTAFIAIGIPCLIYLLFSYLSKNEPSYATHTTTIENQQPIGNLNANNPYASHQKAPNHHLLRHATDTEVASPSSNQNDDHNSSTTYHDEATEDTIPRGQIIHYAKADNSHDSDQKVTNQDHNNHNSSTTNHDEPTTLAKEVFHEQDDQNKPPQTPSLHMDTDVEQDTSQSATLDDKASSSYYDHTTNDHQADKEEDTSLNQTPSQASPLDSSEDHKKEPKKQEEHMQAPQHTTVSSDEEAAFTHALDVLKCMIQAKPLNQKGKGRKAKDKVTKEDTLIYSKLLASNFKDLPPNPKAQWEHFRDTTTSLLFDMNLMYSDYQICMSIFFHDKLKNLLLLNTLISIFPNVTQIECKNTDRTTFLRYRKDYKDTIVNSPFIFGLKNMLANIKQAKKPSKLKKITITTMKNRIQCHLYNKSFKNLGWYIGKGVKTLIITKTPYENLFPKIKAMLDGKTPPQEVTSFDGLVFKLLVNYSARSVSGKVNTILHQYIQKNIDPSLKQQWEEIRAKQQSIILDMYAMDNYYAFFQKELSSTHKHLLNFDITTTLFPNVTEIICKKTDWEIKIGTFGESHSSIVNKNFITGLKEELKRIANKTPNKLQKIVIRTKKYKIESKFALNEFKASFNQLGWEINRGPYTDEIGKTHKKHQLTITKLPRDQQAYILQKEEPSPSQYHTNPPQRPNIDTDTDVSQKNSPAEDYQKKDKNNQ